MAANLVFDGKADGLVGAEVASSGLGPKRSLWESLRNLIARNGPPPAFTSTFPYSPAPAFLAQISPSIFPFSSGKSAASNTGSRPAFF